MVATMSATDNGLRKIVIVLDDELRDAVRAWQLSTQNEGRFYPASSIVLVQVMQVLRDDHGASVPDVRPQRHSSPAVSSSEMSALWQRDSTWRKRARVEVQMHPDTMRALIAVARKSRTVPSPQMLRDMVMSRIGKPLPVCLERLPIPKKRGRRAKRVSADASAVGVDYFARFLKLCAERAARDRWHRRGGKEPPSTIDDHLGRKVYPPNAEHAARGHSRRRAEP
jgi:hypothetical protein